MRLRLRLRGEVGDTVRTFVLPLAEAKVGSASTNEVVLPVVGVSRHHATLRPGDGTVEVGDLESKNGVYVNGTRVSSATLALGDEVRCGPVALRLEAVDEQDVELAVVLSPDAAAPPSAADPSRATATWAGGDTPEWLPVLEQVIPLLRSGAAGLGGALAILVEEAGPEGVCLVELRAGRPVAIVRPRLLPPLHRPAP